MKTAEQKKNLVGKVIEKTGSSIIAFFGIIVGIFKMAMTTKKSKSVKFARAKRVASIITGLVSLIGIASMSGGIKYAYFSFSKRLYIFSKSWDKYTQVSERKDKLIESNIVASWLNSFADHKWIQLTLVILSVIVIFIILLILCKCLCNIFISIKEEKKIKELQKKNMIDRSLLIKVTHHSSEYF